MNRRTLRAVVAPIVILATIIVFIRFFTQHPEISHQLRHVSAGLLTLLLVLYLLSIAALTLATLATLRLCGLVARPGESFLLTAYSAVINFFGPLQSGPAFRAAYLKKKYNVNLRKYATATLVYLAFWGLYSVCMLLSGLLGWWLLLMITAASGAAAIVYRLPLVKRRLAELNMRAWLYLAIATGLQVAAISLIYFCELRNVAPATHYSQAIVYTGAANLALYVSLTPGAIGFRESFLVFSQHLHHIDNATIVAANILDRAAYIILLLLLAIVIFSTHAQRKLTANTTRSKT